MFKWSLSNGWTILLCLVTSGVRQGEILSQKLISEWKLISALKIAQSSKAALSNSASVISVCNSIGVGINSTDSTSKFNLMFTVKIKFVGVI